MPMERKDESDNEDGTEDSDEGGDESVGYLEDPPSVEEKKLLSRQFFPSKLGGSPAWLVPEQLPNLDCPCCSNRMRFLLQVYASQGTWKDSAFHRVLHVFICTNCQPNEVRVFRAQLPRANRFYSAERPDLEAAIEPGFIKPDVELQALCCITCGLPCSNAPAVCTECARRLRNKDKPAVFMEREISVCSAECPDKEEDAADAEQEDEQDEGAKFGDGDIIDEQNAADWDCKGDEHAKVRLKEYQEKVASDREAVLDKSEQKSFEELCNEQRVKDSAFGYFLRYAKVNPSHMLRYELGGVPVWFCEPRQFTEEPDPCSKCGAPRVFEFQVQSPLIALLSGTPLADRLDFGTICVYTCQDCCDAPEGGSPYLEEFVYVQPEPTEEWMPQPT